MVQFGSVPQRQGTILEEEERDQKPTHRSDFDVAVDNALCTNFHTVECVMAKKLDFQPSSL